jgi:hypothetical protein
MVTTLVVLTVEVVKGTVEIEVEVVTGALGCPSVVEEAGPLG